MANPRRTRHFIDGKVQGTLARRIIVHWLVFIVAAALFSFLLQVLTDPFRPLAGHLAAAWWTHGPFLLVTIFLLPVFVVDAIKLSHRFAGPVYSLRRAIREVLQGKPARKLKFRRRDFWHELADDYNALLLRLELVEEPEARAPRDELAAANQ